MECQLEAKFRNSRLEESKESPVTHSCDALLDRIDYVLLILFTIKHSKEKAFMEIFKAESRYIVVLY